MRSPTTLIVLPDGLGCVMDETAPASPPSTELRRETIAKPPEHELRDRARAAKLRHKAAKARLKANRLEARAKSLHERAVHWDQRADDLDGVVRMAPQPTMDE